MRIAHTILLAFVSPRVSSLYLLEVSLLLDILHKGKLWVVVRMMSDGVVRHGGSGPGSHPGGGGGGGGGNGPESVVRAAPVTETSLMESVAGFISEVQTFHQVHLSTSRIEF